MENTGNNRRGTFYRPELDCLRFFAFLFVFISHAFSPELSYYTALGLPTEAARWLNGALLCGGSGVGLFFLLSSYLITELLIRERDRTGRLDVKSFYVRRALRIWPLYFFFLILVYVLIPQSSDYALKSNFLLPMFLLVGNWAVVVYKGMGRSVAGPLWSISVEEQFYLAWPLVVSRLSMKSVRNLCLVMIMAANVLRVVMEKKGAGWVTFLCGTFTWMDTIAAGALLAILLRGGVPRLTRWQRVLLGAGGFAVWVALARFLHYIIYPDIAAYPLVLVGSLMMLLSVMGGSLAHPFLVYLGRISYGLYVFHMAALALTSKLLPQYSPLNILLGLIITILMASLSYRFLEEPFLKLKKRFTIVPSRPVEATLQSESDFQKQAILATESE